MPPLLFLAQCLWKMNNKRLSFFPFWFSASLRTRRLICALLLSVLLHVLLVLLGWSLKATPALSSAEKSGVEVALETLPALPQLKTTPPRKLSRPTQIAPNAPKPTSEPAVALSPASPEPLPVSAALSPSNNPETPAALARDEKTSPVVSAGTTITTNAPYQPAQFNAAYLRNPPPRYPAMSRQLQEEGRVEVLVDVSAAGLPGKVSLKTSSGFPRLDKAALEVVQTWRFVPAKRGDQAEASTVTVPLVFNLQN